MVWFIRYRDDYRRTDTGWRFVRRELHLQWVEDRPVGMVSPASPRRRRRRFLKGGIRRAGPAVGVADPRSGPRAG